MVEERGMAPETGSGARRLCVLPLCPCGQPSGGFTNPPAPSSLETSPPALPKELCVSFVFFPCLFLLLPPPHLCSPPGKDHPFFKPQLNTFPFPAVPGPRKSFSDSLGKVLPNSGSYFDITFRVLPGLPGISGKQDRQHRFKLGCTLGFQLCSTQRRKL